MISFYPGPSKLDPNMGAYMQDAVDTAILERNHRSPEFMELSKKAINVFKDKLNVPPNYEVFFVSAATECWEILSEAFPDDLSFHIYNGAFGEKWMKNKQKLYGNTDGIQYNIQRRISLNHLKNTKAEQAKAICLTQCETSNTTLVNNKTILSIKQRFPESLIMVDATSSMGGIETDWLAADVWYASVQKCFGLPSGLGVMVCSPKMVERALKLNHLKHYNSLASIIQNMHRWQTTHTPNILGIYLLMRVLEERKSIKKESEVLKKRGKYFLKEMKKLGWKSLIDYDSVQSPTVFAFLASEERISEVKEKAKESGLLLGNGYGPWKNKSFRISNFPAHTYEDFEKLLHFFKAYHRNIL